MFGFFVTGVRRTFSKPGNKISSNKDEGISSEQLSTVTVTRLNGIVMIGKIIKEYSNGKLEIQYDDGSIDVNVDRKQIENKIAA